MNKFLISAAILTTLSLGSASALADTPWPECVDNPACNDNEGCSVSTAPGGAATGVGAVVALGAAAAFFARRRLAR